METRCHTGKVVQPSRNCIGMIIHFLISGVCMGYRQGQWLESGYQILIVYVMSLKIS